MTVAELQAAIAFVADESARKDLRIAQFEAILPMLRSVVKVRPMRRNESPYSCGFRHACEQMVRLIETGQR